MKRVAVLAITGLLLSGCASSATPAPSDTGFVSKDGSAVLRAEGQRGEPISFSANWADGGGVWRLESVRGSVVILNSWGPWCAPCRKEVPALQALQDQLGQKGLRVIGLATRSNAASVISYTVAQDIRYPQLADYDSSLVAGIPGVPTVTVPSSILIDRKGRVAGWISGAAEPVLLRDLVTSLLEESS